MSECDTFDIIDDFDIKDCVSENNYQVNGRIEELEKRVWKLEDQLQECLQINKFLSNQFVKIENMTSNDDKMLIFQRKTSNIISSLHDIHKKINKIVFADKVIKRDRNYCEMMSWLVDKMNKELTQNMINSGHCPSIGLDDERAFIQAIKYDQPEIVKYLIDKGISVNIKNKHGDTALHLTSTNEREALFNMLINAKANVNFENNKGETPLYIASYFGHHDKVKMLIKAGAQLDVRSNNGHTALIWAVKRGYFDITQSLVEAGADINIKNDNGNSALDWSVILGYTQITAMLRSKKFKNDGNAS